MQIPHVPVSQPADKKMNRGFLQETDLAIVGGVGAIRIASLEAKEVSAHELPCVLDLNKGMRKLRKVCVTLCHSIIWVGKPPGCE
jgi:hypothetical protein